MDDLVVILLTLLVAVIGIVGQSKKRKAASQRPVTGTPRQNVWDLLESQIAPESGRYEPEAEFELDDEIVDSVPKTPVYDFDPKNEGKSMMKEQAGSSFFAEEIKKPKK